MKNRLSLIVGSALLSWMLALPASAQEPPEAEKADIETLINAIRHNRTQLVSVNMDFSTAEAAAFWPVFEKFDNERNAVGDRMVALLEEYAANYTSMTDEQAVAIVNKMLKIEEDRAEIRSKYLDDFSKALPGRKLARFYQLENKLDAVMRFQLARGVPVVKP